MRSLTVMFMFAASVAQAGWDGYTDEKSLELDAAGIGALDIEAGAGSLVIRGVDGLDRIAVKATIAVSDADEADAVRFMNKKMKLSLEGRCDRAMLTADFDGGWGSGWTDARIDLEVSVPADVALSIDDGAGSIDVSDLVADLSIEDASGSIDVRNVASVVIEDGSGSIDVSEAAGDVTITDGSGSISVRSVAGSVTIDDGSGSINVNDVEKDLIIVDDGSGGLSFADVRGSVENES